MKLAPTQNQLQPLPPNVAPAVSQNVQRAATPADLQTIQNVQASEQSASVQQPSGVPAVPIVPYSPSDTLALWVAIATAVIVVAGAFWLWRSF